MDYPGIGVALMVFYFMFHVFPHGDGLIQIYAKGELKDELAKV